MKLQLTSLKLIGIEVISAFKILLFGNYLQVYLAARAKQALCTWQGVGYKIHQQEVLSWMNCSNSGMYLSLNFQELIWTLILYYFFLNCLVWRMPHSCSCRGENGYSAVAEYCAQERCSLNRFLCNHSASESVTFKYDLISGNNGMIS